MSRVLKNSVPCRHCGELKVPGGALASHERSCDISDTSKRKRSRYREVFLAHSGPGPYACFFECGSEVSFDELIVHHVDGDHTNDSIENLVAAHRLCHNGHHFAEAWKTNRDALIASSTRGNHKPHTEEAKKKMSDTKKQLGQRPSDEARALAILANTGSKRSGETRAKISAKARNRTPEHQAKLNAANTGKIRSKEARRRMSESAKARIARKSVGGDAK